MLAMLPTIRRAGFGVLAAAAVLASTGSWSAAGATPTPSATSTAPSTAPSASGSASPSSRGSQASQGERATFGVQPASVANGVVTPDQRPYFFYAVTPGGTIRDHVAFVNYSTFPLQLRVYVTDALNTDAGGLGLLPQNQKPTDAGAWATLGTGIATVTVPGRSTQNGVVVMGRVVLPLTVHVPADAAPGDHVGGVVAALEVKSTDKKGVPVILDQRVGSRLYLRVSGPLHPRLSVEHLQVKYHDSWNPFTPGWAEITYTIRNTGNVKLGSRQHLTVSGLLGLHGVAPKLEDLSLLLPNGATKVRVRVNDVWPQFRITAGVDLTPLQLRDDVDPAVSRESVHVGAWALPWGLLATIVVLIGGVFGARLLRKRRKPGGRHSSGGPGGTTGTPSPQPEPEPTPVEVG